MTQYNSLNVKLSNSQLNKLKSAIKNETEVVLRLSSNMIGNSDDETNFPHELLLTNKQVANLRKEFVYYSSTNIKLSKTQLSKIIQSRGFLGRLLSPLVITGLPLIKNIIEPLNKSILIPLGLTASASAADAGIHTKILGFDHPLDSALHTTTLIISDDEMEDILKIVKSLEDSDLLLKGVREIIQNEVDKQKGGFISMLLGTLCTNFLGNILAGKGITKAGYGAKGGKGIIRAGYGSQLGF